MLHLNMSKIFHVHSKNQFDVKHTIHDGKETFLCDMCDVFLPSKNSLLSHKYKKHIVRNVVCNISDKRFLKISNL